MGVVTRASTNMLAVDDPVVVRAMEFIRRRVDQPTTVEDVLDQLVVSRKSLERKFAHYLGRTPLEEIRQVHISRVKELLSDTDCDMRQIARLSGFVRPEHMATVFRSLAGMTPTQWRRQFRHR
jgi:LacI family transcriptional regulator